MSLQQVLDGLRRDYLNGIPEKIERIHQLWKASDFEELHTEFHKMKGTGRTYGLPEISQVGEALESLFESKDTQLDPAVKLATTLLERIRDSRQADTPYDLENDPDFRTIIALLSKP